jgi:hypothetical protein
MSEKDPMIQDKSIATVSDESYFGGEIVDDKRLLLQSNGGNIPNCTPNSSCLIVQDDGKTVFDTDGVMEILDNMETLRDEYFPVISNELDASTSGNKRRDSETSEGTSTTTQSTTTLSTSRRLPDGSVIIPLNMDQMICTEELLEEELGLYPSIPGSTSHCLRSLYGEPLSSKTVSDIIGPRPTTSSAAGLRYDAILIPDDPKILDRLIKRRLLDPKRYFIDSKIGEIKPRRGPNPVVYLSDFMKSLVQIHSTTNVSTSQLSSSTTRPYNGGDKNILSPRRWVFSGVLNGWPGLTHLEVLSITCRLVADKVSFLFEKDRFSNLHHAIQKLPTRVVSVWNWEKEGIDGSPPYIPPDWIQRAIEIKVTLRAPSYTAKGYSNHNSGYLFWFEAQRLVRKSQYSDTSDEVTVQQHLEPRVLYGENMIQTMEREGDSGDGNSVCTKVHMLSHRYATGDKREHPKDKLTYHSVLILEWDHGNYVTVIESALLNGLGGYAGKSNWYDDKLDDLPKLYEAMPPCMIQPWTPTLSEIRCFDVPHSRTLEEFKSYVRRYTGPKLRFLDPQWTHSHPARLFHRTKVHIARYLYNYIRRNPQYSEINRNCQTFSADLFGFLAGKNPQDIQPFHPLNRVDYKNRAHYFLYDPDMFGSTTPTKNLNTK